jgi:hypothetical protein
MGDMAMSAVIVQLRSNALEWQGDQRTFAQRAKG